MLLWIDFPELFKSNPIALGILTLVKSETFDELAPKMASGSFSKESVLRK